MRLSIVVILVLVVSLSASAQRVIDEDAGWSIEERWYTGLGLGGLGFGTSAWGGNYFSIGGSVLGGYMITKNLSAGVGFEYQYTSYSGPPRGKTHLYGGYPFLRYNIKNFFLQTDYDIFKMKIDVALREAEASSDRFLVGVGYSSPTRGRAFMNFLVSYDFLYTNTDQLFGSPLNTRLFFTF